MKRNITHILPTVTLALALTTLGCVQAKSNTISLPAQAQEEFSMDLSYNTPTSYMCDTVGSITAHAQRYNEAGMQQARDGNLEEAIESYITAIECDPRFAPAWNNVAVAYWRRGLSENARLALHHALALNPHFAEAHNNLGTISLHDKKYETAEKALKNAVQLRPDYEKAYLNLVRLYLEQGEEERAWDYGRSILTEVGTGFLSLANFICQREESLSIYREVLKV